MKEKKKKILVPTSGYLAAKERVDTIIDIASRLNAEIEVVHIRDPKVFVATTRESEGWEALKIFERKGREEGVKVISFYTSGDLVTSLVRFAGEHDVDLILMGSSSGRVIAEWIVSDLLKGCDIPVLILPQDFSELI
jgi:nucleotide-binding universal stress UspA family protein